MICHRQLLCGVVLLISGVVVVAGCSQSGASPQKSKPAAAADAKSSPTPKGSPDEKIAVEPKSAETELAAVTPKKSEAAAKKSNKVMLGDPSLTAGIPGEGKLTLAELRAWLDDPSNHEVLEIELPLGLAAGKQQVKGLDKNPLTRAKIELGRQLYFDSRLSADENVSCASCHDPDEGFGRHTRFGVGIKGQMGGRNSPVSYNRILSDAQFWDGRASSLEDQAVGPIKNAIEMGNTHEGCVSCLDGIKGYKLQFKRIFGKLDIESVGKALACFERALVTGPSPFDYYERLKPFEKLDPDDIKENAELAAKFKEATADAKAHPMSESARRGRDLFFSDKANCTACHVGANLADEKYHNLGIGMDQEKPDLGRYEVTKDEKDKGAFKTPTIRNVKLSYPYMHDGSIKTLAEVVDWYAKGGHPNPGLDEKVKKLNLTDQDKADLVEFMNACTGDFPKIERKRLPE